MGNRITSKAATTWVRESARPLSRNRTVRSAVRDGFWMWLACLGLAYVGSARGETYVIVDTGQDVTYNSSSIQTAAPGAGERFNGQDAQYDGTPSSYTVSRDGLTVYDNNTGLTWVQTPDTAQRPTPQEPVKRRNRQSRRLRQ